MTTSTEYLIEIFRPGQDVPVSYTLSNPQTVQAAVEAEERSGNRVRVSTRETTTTTTTTSTDWQER